MTTQEMFFPFQMLEMEVAFRTTKQEEKLAGKLLKKSIEKYGRMTVLDRVTPD